MISIGLDWTKKNTWDFVIYYSLKRSKMYGLMIGLAVICMLFVVIFSVAAYSITKATSIIFTGIGGLILLIFFVVGFYLIMRSMAKKLLAANTHDYKLSADITDKVVLLKKNGEPFVITEWKNVSEIFITENAAYVFLKENAIVLFEYSQIISGEKAELEKILKEKELDIKFRKEKEKLEKPEKDKKNEK